MPINKKGGGERLVQAAKERLGDVVSHENRGWKESDPRVALLVLLVAGALVNCGVAVVVVGILAGK